MLRRKKNCGPKHLTKSKHKGSSKTEKEYEYSIDEKQPKLIAFLPSFNTEFIYFSLRTSGMNEFTQKKMIGFFYPFEGSYLFSFNFLFHLKIISFS